MVVNAVRSFWRRAARRDLSVDPANLLTVAVADEADRIEDREVLVAALRRLPPKQRTAPCCGTTRACRTRTSPT